MKAKKSKPWIQREGKLGGPGYTDRADKTRHAILKRCVEGGTMKLDGGTFDSPAYGYRSCLGSLQVLLRNRDIEPRTRAIIESDIAWLKSHYGGEARAGNGDCGCGCAGGCAALKAKLLR